MNIGITGGNGFIGSQLIQLLLQEDHRISCLIRKTSNLQWIEHRPIEFTYGDVRDPDSLEVFVSNKDIIFHLAGLVKGTPEALDDANAKGTGNLLEAVMRFNQRIQHFVFVSSQEAVGLIGGEAPWTEELPPAPATAYGRSKARGEEVCRSYMPQVPITVIRPSPVYGPRDRETFVFFKMAARGFGIVPNPKTRVSVIYSENLAWGIYRAGTSDGSIGSVYFLADDDVISWNDLNRLIGDALGKQPKQIRIPPFILKTGAAFSEFFSSLAGKSSIVNRDKISMLIHPNLVVSNEKAKRDFGYTQRIPIEEAIRLTVDWYKKEGWI